MLSKLSIDPRSTRAVIGIFAMLSLLPVVALGVGLSDVVNQGVQQQSLADANRTAAILAQAGIQPLLVPSDLTTGLSDARLAQLDGSLRGVAFGKVISRLKIWNRDNVVVYSDNRALVGHAFPADDNLNKALAGQSASEISDAKAPENRADNLTGTFLSVYVPIYFAADRQTASGAFEIYLPWAPVAAQIDQESRQLNLLLGAGLAMLYFAMIPVLLVAERWRRRLTASLTAIEDERRRGEEAERVSELKSSFLSSMSHDMRTPLNAVLGFTQLLRAPGFGELSERQDRFVQNIAQAGRHLLALTNDVLDLSKIEAGRMDLQIADVALAEVVGEVEEILRPLSDAKSLSISIVALDVSVRADRLRLTQVLVNILSNAIKFTPAEGSIRVSAERSGDWVDVDVIDSGCGIPAEEQRAVFERYTSDNNRTDGTGLGLPLSRRLVELMGGELTLVASTPAGSNFRIRIPGSAEGTEPVPVGAESEPGNERRLAPLESVSVARTPSG